MDIKREQPDSSGGGWRGRREEALPEAARWTAEANTLKARQLVPRSGRGPRDSPGSHRAPFRFSVSPLVFPILPCVAETMLLQFGAETYDHHMEMW